MGDFVPNLGNTSSDHGRFWHNAGDGWSEHGRLCHFTCDSRLLTSVRMTGPFLLLHFRSPPYWSPLIGPNFCLRSLVSILVFPIHPPYWSLFTLLTCPSTLMIQRQRRVFWVRTLVAWRQWHVFWRRMPVARCRWHAFWIRTLVAQRLWETSDRCTDGWTDE